MIGRLGILLFLVGASVSLQAADAPLANAQALAIHNVRQRIKSRHHNYKRQLSFANGAVFLRFCFGMNALEHEARYAQQQKHIAQLKVAATDLAKDSASTSEEMDDVIKQVGKAAKHLEFLRNQVRESHKIASGFGIAQDTISPRNDWINKLATTAGHGMEMGAVADAQVGKRTVLRMLFLVLDSLLGAARNLPNFYTTRKRMVLTTAAQRLFRLINSGLTHGFKKLSKRQIAVYVLQSLALCASFAGSHEERGLTHFNERGWLAPAGDVTPGLIQEAVMQANAPGLPQDIAQQVRESIASIEDDPLLTGIRPPVVVQNGAVSRKLADRKAILAAMKVADDGTRQCVICLEDPSQDQKPLSMSICDDHVHAFHKGCLGKWLRLNNTCPSCRRVFTELHESA